MNSASLRALATPSQKEAPRLDEFHSSRNWVYAPQRVISNADLEKIVRTNNEWIVSRTGIKERRVAADHEATSDLAAAAGREALQFAGVKPDDVDMIIVCTVTGDTPTPSCASFVQAQLGAKNAFAFDVGAACAGSLYGLSIADQFIRSGKVKRALVIGAETSAASSIGPIARHACCLATPLAQFCSAPAKRKGAACSPRACARTVR